MIKTNAGIVFFSVFVALLLVSVNLEASNLQSQEIIYNAGLFVPEKPLKDPFKALVVKKTIAMESRIVRESEKSLKTDSIVSEPVKPIKIKVTGICGNKKLRYAVIDFQGKEYSIIPGETVAKKFKVISITESKVTVYSNEANKRMNFSLIGN